MDKFCGENKFLRKIFVYHKENLRVHTENENIKEKLGIFMMNILTQEGDNCVNLNQHLNHPQKSLR